MRILLICISLMMATSLWAQGPAIDSMRVDEWGRALVVRGEFGFAKGAVWCDSVELPIISWSDTMIRAAIPDSGRGSAGPVVVGAKGYTSQARMLSYLSGRAGSGPSDIKFGVRLDLHSSIKNNTTLPVSLSLTRSSHLIVNYAYAEYSHGSGSGIHASDDHVPYISSDSVYSYGFQAVVVFSMESKQLSIAIKKVKGVTAIYERAVNGSLVEHRTVDFAVADFSIIAPLDSNFVMKTNAGVSEISTLFLPSGTLIFLGHAPTLLSPHNAHEVNRDGIVLVWASLQYMERYRVQYSTDPTFATVLIDTTIESLKLDLLPLSKNTAYYWRVAGSNDEGQSKWSEVWEFITNTTLSIQHSSTAPQIALYPNPAHDRLYINVAPEPGSAPTSDVQVSIADLLGREVLRSSSLSGERTALPLSLVPGTYMCRINVGEVVATKRLVIE